MIHTYKDFFSRNTQHGMKQTSTSIRKNNNSQYVADWILYKIYSEIHKEVLLLQFIARLIILLTLQQLYKTLSKQYYWSPQERCSLIKRFYIVIDWNSTELHRVNSPVGIIHTVSTTPRRKDEVAMPDPLTWRTLKRLSALKADTPSYAVNWVRLYLNSAFRWCYVTDSCT